MVEYLLSKWLAIYYKYKAQGVNLLHTAEDLFKGTTVRHW